MKIRLLSPAEEEFSDAAAYYEDQDEGLGDRFIEHILHSIQSLERQSRWLVSSTGDREQGLSSGL